MDVALARVGDHEAPAVQLERHGSRPRGSGSRCAARRRRRRRGSRAGRAGRCARRPSRSRRASTCAPARCGRSSSSRPPSLAGAELEQRQAQRDGRAPPRRTVPPRAARRRRSRARADEREAGALRARRRRRARTPASLRRAGVARARSCRALESRASASTTAAVARVGLAGAGTHGDAVGRSRRGARVPGCSRCARRSR